MQNFSSFTAKELQATPSKITFDLRKWISYLNEPVSKDVYETAKEGVYKKNEGIL